MLGTIKIFFLSIIVCVIFIISACNTVEGFGEDVQSAGEAIEDAAKDVKDKI